MNISPPIRQRFFDANGLPLNGGLLYSYAAGTATPLTTYLDNAGTTNTNPVVLDADGYADLWINPTLLYKFVLHDSDGNLLWTKDRVGLSFDASLIDSLGDLSQYIAATGRMFQGSNVQDALDFLNPYVSGSKASPTSQSGSVAMSLQTSVERQTWVIKGNGGAVTGVTLPTASMAVGQQLTLIGGHDTNTVTIAQGASGTVMSGDLVLGATSSGSRSAVCRLEFDGTNWQEVSRT